MKRILMVKTTSMGDVIHALPAVQDILQHYPDAQIDWLVEESFADIPRLHPHVHQVFTVAVRRWRKQVLQCSTWHEIRAIKRALAAQAYDAVIDVQGLVKSAWIANWARGPHHGYDAQSIREPLASRFYQHRYAISYQQHAVTRIRTLVALSLGYTAPQDLPDYGLGTTHSAAGSTTLTLPPKSWIALHATSRDSKLWPESHWIALGQHYAELGLTMCLPWASAAEKDRAGQIALMVPQALVLPKLSLQQLATVLPGAQFAVGVDTGLSHLAAALDVPVVALYTDTDPGLTGVAGGRKAAAINLGGKQQVPDIAAVIAAVTTVTTANPV
ncbi:lipopolysaccharide heptosyltransferase I [Methylophilus flavus]|uniref:Lipopolysaccharide heptosyltransferase 1 n=1 Tax=Methylophilus flavus TaxID=640084 RepID=A0ABW3PD79_9PROT